MSKLNNSKKELEDILQLVSFKIENEEYGIDILKVQEINKMVPITKIPNSPVYIDGVINLRGRVIPIIDLRTRLLFERKEHTKDTRIIVVDLERKTVGFIVDEVNEVLRIPSDITEAPPELVADKNFDYITKVGKLEDRLLILLDLEKVFKQDEKEVLVS